MEPDTGLPTDADVGELINEMLLEKGGGATQGTGLPTDADVGELIKEMLVEKEGGAMQGTPPSGTGEPDTGRDLSALGGGAINASQIPARGTGPERQQGQSPPRKKHRGPDL